MPFLIEETITIDAPAAVVWEVVSDLPRYPEWNPFCLECSSTLRPGDPIDMKVKLRGEPQRQREWMTEFVDGQRFAYRMRPVPLGALSSLRSHDIEAEGGSRTRYRSYFRLQGWLRPLVLALFGARLEQGFGEMNQAVRRRAETLWAARRPAQV